MPPLLLPGRLAGQMRPERAREAAAFVQMFGTEPRLAGALREAGLL